MRRPGRRADAGVSTSGRDTADQRFNEILAKWGAASDAGGPVRRILL